MKVKHRLINVRQIPKLIVPIPALSRSNPVPTSPSTNVSHPQPPPPLQNNAPNPLETAATNSNCARTTTASPSSRQLRTPRSHPPPYPLNNTLFYPASSSRFPMTGTVDTSVAPARSSQKYYVILYDRRPKSPNRQSVRLPKPVPRKTELAIFSRYVSQQASIAH